MSQQIAVTLLDAAAALREAAEKLRFEKAAYTYNPLSYAWQPYRAYVTRYGRGPVGRNLLVGMNPGPWGMAQTGVPFGDPVTVREWMGITGQVQPFADAHWRYPVKGFSSSRREGSGKRLYGWAGRHYGSAERFFEHFFVLNYFPLMLLDKDGKNLTPERLPASERAMVAVVCDLHLRACLQAIDPRCVVGVGRYAAEQSRQVVKELGLDIPVPRLVHPSPANPQANRGWEALADAELSAAGVEFPDWPSDLSMSKDRDSS